MSRAAEGSFSSTCEKHGKQKIASFCKCNFGTALIAVLRSAAFKCFLATACHCKTCAKCKTARSGGLETCFDFSFILNTFVRSEPVFGVPLLSG